MEEIAVRGRDILHRVRSRVRAGRAEAREKGLELKGKGQVVVGAEASINVKGPGGGVTPVRELAGNPTANRHMFYGQLKDEPLPGVGVKPKSRFSRNTSFDDVDGDVFSPYLAIQRVLKMYGEEAGREILKKHPLFMTVQGRKMCDDCMKDLPKLAAHYDIPAVLLFDAKRAQFLFWRRGMELKMVPLGRHTPVIDPTAAALKGSAIAGPGLLTSGKED